MAKEKKPTTSSFDGLTSNYLKGSDLKKDVDVFTCTDVNIEEMQDGKNVLVMDINYNGNEKLFSCNKTNTNKLKEFVDTPKDLIGKQIHVKKVLVTNPQSKEEVESIRVTKVE